MTETTEQLKRFYNKMSVRQLQEIVERLNDHIDYNLETTPTLKAAADESRERRSLIQSVIASK